MSSQNIINPKPCNYNCGTRIYWDTVSNSFLEVFSKQKHVCPNRVNKTNTTTNTNRPYYNKKPWSTKPKVPSSNSIELITGPFDSVQKKYEILSDIVTEYQGKVHGSQSNITGNNISLIVYYEVQQGSRDQVKEKYKNYIRAAITL